MPEIKLIKILLLVNPNGDKTQLHFGRLKDPKDFNGDKDTGFRWMFTGKKIPMPIRSEEWFNGFPEATMLNWLRANGGWVVHAIWTANTNKMTVVDLPSAPVETETDWVPVNSGKYPADYIIVQPTYLNSVSGAPMCNAMVYRSNNVWYWSGTRAKVDSEITAWRYCDPYKGTMAP